MNIRQIPQFSGIIISAGFVAYIAAMLVAPQLYNTTDISRRLAIIDTQKARWYLSQILFALGPSLAAAGFLLLAYSRRQTPASWLYLLGTVLFAAGSAMAVGLVIRQTLDPAAFWTGEETPLLIGYGWHQDHTPSLAD
ncbi:MAG: hypothetical protein ACK2UK_06045 [Candidatus Promineifilaceae bacterium]